MKKETVIYIIAIAALAALYYFFIYKKKETTTQTAIVPTPGGTVAAPVTQAAVVNGPPAINATATGASQTLTTAPDVTSPRPVMAVQPGAVVTIDSSQYDAIDLPWINSLGVANKQQALKMYPQMTMDEKAKLADIITNVWGGKRAQTADDTLFWNTWRVKYHILDGTYSPFSGDPQTAYPGSNSFSDNPQDAYVAHGIDPLAPVTGSQTPNNFTIKGSGGQPYNGFKKGARKKK